MNIKLKYQGNGNDFIIINKYINFFPKNDNKLISECIENLVGAVV